MSKLTCRECGQPEHPGECRPAKLQAERDAAICKVGRLSRELGAQDIRIKDLEAINEFHRVENGKLQARIKELEELIPTPKEAMWLLDRIGIDKYLVVNYPIVTKLKSIAREK